MSRKPGQGFPKAFPPEVKQRVLALIAKEDERNPLLDEQIAEILRGEGVPISRRCVTKYRRQFRFLRNEQRRVVERRDYGFK